MRPGAKQIVLVGVVSTALFTSAVAIPSATSAEPRATNPCLNVAPDPSTKPATLPLAQKPLVPAALTPPIKDPDNGYELTKRDLAFTHTMPLRVIKFKAKMTPLTMKPGQYRSMLRSYRSFLKARSALKTDVRMKGSGVDIFSGPHKTLPKNVSEAAVTYKEEHSVWPTHAWCKSTANAYFAWFGAKQERPQRRPIDSMYYLGVTSHKSDIDIQISSNQLVHVARSTWESDPELHKQPFLHRFGFVQRAVVAKAFPDLTAISDKYAAKTGRPVAPALFDSNGPQNEQSKFKPTDWIMIKCKNPCPATSTYQ